MYIVKTVKSAIRRWKQTNSLTLGRNCFGGVCLFHKTKTELIAQNKTIYSVQLKIYYYILDIMHHMIAFSNQYPCIKK